MIPAAPTDFWDGVKQLVAKGILDREYGRPLERDKVVTFTSNPPPATPRDTFMARTDPPKESA